jgi:sorting nexin-9/18/33
LTIILFIYKLKLFNARVKRRYNHFDWLHERLCEKYPNICIPPLPSKAVTGNFEDDFIAKRKSQLELWLNRMSSHPVVGQSEVFVHFLQCDDGSSKWKAGKRKAEKDEYKGAQWFCTLTVPGESVDTTTGIKERVDRFAKAANNLNNCFRNVGSGLDKIGYNHTNVYKKELCNLGKRFEETGITLSNESLDVANNALLSAAFVSLGNTYNQIGNMYGEQCKQDILPLLDRMQLYQGILSQMPDIIQIEKSAIQLYEEYQQKPEKLEGKSLMEVAPRREIISHVTFAEINQFNKDKVDDLTIYMKNYLQQQIAFYTEITECLKKAYANFEKIPVSALATANASPSYGQSFKK